MPCFDPRFDNSPGLNNAYRQIANNEISFREIEAMLCGICRVLEKNDCLEDVLSSVDWCDAGVSVKGFKFWFTEHKKLDQYRSRGKL